ncbi:MAG: glycosyltransferase family 39 protein [Candidatus Aureabacteria bacterium]|nr:glycosyltransferase family 39 protein [Candidatus Auribacterota bacterium]
MKDAMNADGESRNARSREAVWILAVFLLACALGLFALSRFRFVGSDGGIDGVEMARTGQNLFSGKGFTSRGRPELVHSPLFPILIGAVWRATGDLELSGQMVSVLFNALTVIPVFFLARAMFCFRTAFLAALFTAVCPFSLYTATEIRVEALYTFLVSLTALALYRFALSPRPRQGLFSGAAVGLAYLARPEAVIFLLLGALLPALAPGPPLRQKMRRALGGWIVFAAAFLVFAAPYWLYLRAHLGYWTMSARMPFTLIPYFEGNWETANFRAYAYPEALRAEWLTRGGMIAFLQDHAFDTVKHLRENLMSLVLRAQSPRFAKFGIPPRLISLGLPLVVAGGAALLAFKILCRRFRFRDAFLLLFISVSLPYIVFISNAFFTPQELRYFYYYLPLGYIVVASLCSGWMNFLSRKAVFPIRTALILAPASVIAMGMLLASLYLIRHKIETVPYEYKLLGLWMKETIPGVEKALVMSRKFGVSFYADARHALIYPGDFGEIIRYAREMKADYLVVDDWSTPWARPALAFLLDDAAPPPRELHRITTVAYRGRKTVLYAFSHGAGGKDPR